MANSKYETVIKSWLYSSKILLAQLLKKLCESAESLRTT